MLTRVAVFALFALVALAAGILFGSFWGLIVLAFGAGFALKQELALLLACALAAIFCFAAVETASPSTAIPFVLTAIAVCAGHFFNPIRSFR